MDEPPIKKLDPATQKRVTDYWKPAQTLMGQADFLDRVVGYKSEELTEKHIKDLQVFLDIPTFNKEYMMKINPTAANFAAWAIAMKNLYQVNLIVKPKQAQLAEAMAKYNEVNGVLKIKQAELKVIMDKVNGLRRELKQCQDDKA
jgi:dynein heavy chain